METTLEHPKTADEILDSVLLNFRIEDGKFLANLGDSVVEIKELVRKGDNRVFVTYYDVYGNETTVHHHTY